MRRNKNPIVKKSNRKKKIILVTVAVLVVLTGGLAVTELTDTTTLFHERKAVSSTIAKASSSSSNKNGAPSGDKSESTAPQSSAPEPTPNIGSPKEGDTPTNSSGAALIEPYGNFVSNHTPGKNGAPSVITSVCITTPGAKCTITFTSVANPAVVKTLEAGTAGADGAVYWNNWDVRAAGFTNGAWNIKANATLGGQAKSAADSIAFEVQL